MPAESQQEESWKKRAAHEFRLYWIYVLFFTLLFWAFELYKRLLLAEYSIGFIQAGYNLVEALVLAKIILIGQAFNLGERFSGKPLIIPTLYKSLVFTCFVLVFSLLEHFVEGYLEGKEMAHVFQNLISTEIYVILAKTLILFIIFLFFFAFLEIDRVLGKSKLYRLFFKTH